MIEFCVPGVPTPKGRPKVTTIAGRPRMYTPAKTAAYEAVVRMYAEQAMAGRAPEDGPVDVRVEVYLPVPGSWSKRKRAEALAGLVMPTKKPDIDNVEKAVYDALNAVVFTDDARVVDGSKRKRYSDRPRVVVRVAKVEGLPA